jgi:hypothetical protein
MLSAALDDNRTLPLNEQQPRRGATHTRRAFREFSHGGHLWVGRQNEVVSEVTAFLNKREDGRPRGAR